MASRPRAVSLFVAMAVTGVGSVSNAQEPQDVNRDAAGAAGAEALKPAAPSDAVGGDAEAAKALQRAAAALEKSGDALTKSGEALSSAGKKLSEKDDEEKTAASGYLSNGRTGWNGVLLTFKEKTKRATASVSAPLDGGTWLLSGSLTAPLDSDTRLAAFLDSRQRFKPFEGSVRFEYNAMNAHLKEWMKSRSWTIPDCEAFRRSWQAEQEAKPEEDRKRTPRCPGDEFDEWKTASTPGPVDGLSESPVPQGLNWTLGVEVKFGFDRQDVYVDDLAAKTQNKTTSQLEALAVGRFYPTHWLAIPVRVGGGFDDAFKADKISRCKQLASSDSAVSAKSCEDALFLKEDSKTVGTFAAEVAAVAVVPGVTAAMVPGIEVRERLDVAGATTVNKLSLAIFATPTAKPVVTRFGVGLEHNWALSDAEGDDPDFKKGDRWLVPFLLVGASL